MGLDIDLSHVHENYPCLQSRGAFVQNKPELHEFDQFQDNSEHLGSLLGGDKAHVVIDDGIHTDEAILSTLKSFYPYLASEFVYFIEDNCSVSRKIARQYPEFNVFAFGEMTVVQRAA